MPLTVARASEGLGAAFATALAARTEACDLGRPELANLLTRVTEGLEIGVAIYNAAYAPVGAVLKRTTDELLRVVDVNVRGPLIFARTLAPQMVARGRGGVVLMSSLAGRIVIRLADASLLRAHVPAPCTAERCATPL